MAPCGVYDSADPRGLRVSQYPYEQSNGAKGYLITYSDALCGLINE